MPLKRSSSSLAAVTLGVILAGSVAFPADAGNTASELRKLRQRTTSLERRVRALAFLVALPDRPPSVYTHQARAIPRSDGYAYAIAYCPAGETRTGGGATWERGHTTDDHLLSSGPDGTGGWVAEGISNSRTALTVTVLCAS